MNVRIGIADSGREIELDVDDPAELEARIEQAYSDGTEILWVNDTKSSRFGVPVARIAFVEITTDVATSVGFG